MDPVDSSALAVEEAWSRRMNDERENVSAMTHSEAPIYSQQWKSHVVSNFVRP